jgi:mannose-6-phosphate isomerase-like protein (cupin superfamily)
MLSSLNVRLVVCCSAALCAFAAVLPSGALFENSDVKVTRALEKVHVKGGFHEHKPNRVMVYLQDGQQRFEYQDGRAPKVFNWKAGQVVWSPPEGMHSPEVVGPEPFNIVEIELKKPGGGKLAVGARDAVKLDAKHFKVELENDQVRVLRLKLAAHQATPMVDFPRNIVAVYLTDQDWANHKAGDAEWQAPGPRKLENAGDKPLEMILVEVGS